MYDDTAFERRRKIPKQALQQLIETLRSQSYTVVGPTIADGAIVYAEISSVGDLPLGYRESQGPAKYRLSEGQHSSYFEFNMGPHSWKQFLFPPRMTVASGKREAEGWTFQTNQESQPKYAFLGVRACELAAIAIQDRIFLQGAYVDPVYKARREALLIIAVNCTVAAATCFCTSMETGPKCRSNFDLALTELDEGFLVESATERGAALVSELDSSLASNRDIEEADWLQERAVEQITKRMETKDLRELLLGNLEHSHWDDVATRCLSCANCTLVCPTCFCSSVSEVADLAGENVQRQRQWDSCFNIDFSYTASGTVRNDRRSRFRQWLTHKLASWHDQFESSGCVGCGRCITWCPVGIDLTAEVAAIRSSSGAGRTLPVVQPVKTACSVPQEPPL